jgi:hypothetical protein
VRGATPQRRYLGLALGKIKLKGVITAQICWFSHNHSYSSSLSLASVYKSYVVAAALAGMLQRQPSVGFTVFCSSPLCLMSSMCSTRSPFCLEDSSRCQYSVLYTLRNFGPACERR